MTQRARTLPAAPPGGTAHSRRQATRDSILNAAHTVVAQRGFGGTQISHIAHEAGVAVGSIYKHFESRNNLFAELYSETVLRELDVLKRATSASQDTALARLSVAIETFSSRALRGGRFALALLAEPAEPFLDELRLKYRAEYRAFFAGLIEAANAEGSIQVENFAVSSAAVLGLMTEILTMPASESSPRLRQAALVDLVLDICKASLRADLNS